MLLYFVAGIHSAGRSKLAELGLEHAFPEGVDVAVRQSASGPEGQSGVVVCSDAERCGYLPTEQEWREISPAFGRRRWVGREREARPTPESLQRKQVLPGVAVELADGQQWIIPRAYAVDGDSYHACLPRTASRTPDGEWVTGAPLPRYRALWEIAQRLYDAVAIGDSSKYSVRLMYDDLAHVVGVNYRLGPDECGFLGLFDSEMIAAKSIAAAVIDLDGLIELQKKREPRGD